MSESFGDSAQGEFVVIDLIDRRSSMDRNRHLDHGRVGTGKTLNPDTNQSMVDQPITDQPRTDLSRTDPSRTDPSRPDHEWGSEPGADIVEFYIARNYCASVEIHDLTNINMQYAFGETERTLAAVGKLLRAQFHSENIRRDHSQFSVGCDDFEYLLAGLLRVQFYAQQIVLPEFTVFGEKTIQSGLTIVWGVGRTYSEARAEQQKKKQVKAHRLAQPQLRQK